MDSVSVGNELSVYGTYTGEIFQLVNNVPEMIDGSLAKVAVGSDGKLWGTDQQGKVYERTRGLVSVFDEWEIQDDAPSLSLIDVGSRFLVAGIGLDNKMYLFRPDGLLPVLQLQNLDELLMCARFAEWAYLILPIEPTWWWTSSSQLLESVLAGSPWRLWKAYDEQPSSTEAFLAYAPINHTIILSIRGSWEIRDFVADLTDYAWFHKPRNRNFNISYWVHTAWTSIESQVKADMAALIQSLGGPSSISNIYIVGHSLGAAIATYGAYDLFVSNVFGGVPLSKIRMVNFASPPVGDASFVSAYTALGITSYRVIDPNDQILAPVGWLKAIGWTDVGQLVPVPAGSGHSIAGYINTLTRLYQNTAGQFASSLKQHPQKLEVVPDDAEEG